MAVFCFFSGESDRRWLLESENDFSGLGEWNLELLLGTCIVSPATCGLPMACYRCFQEALEVLHIFLFVMV